MKSASLLVVAGEASGDRAAAAVLTRLAGSKVRAWGMGGGALEREGMELVADLRDLTAMGFVEVARHAASVAVAYARIRARIANDAPSAALLVGYTEFNARLAPLLWARGCPVLWYGAPQIWAWRAGRGKKLRRHVDRMAVVLPFEEKIWRDLGVDARYVGHPALEERAKTFAHGATEARLSARELLGMTRRAWAVGILPGSRPHEARKLVVPMLEGYEEVRREHASVDGRVLLAPSLDEETRAFVRDAARRFHVEVADIDARAGIASALPAFDAALCASGTASLECALARAIPVVCYRVGWLTEKVARATLSTAHVALPNILVGRRLFPELLQDECEPRKIAEHLERALVERDAYLVHCDEVERALGGRQRASAEVAAVLAPWLGLAAAEAPGRRRKASG